MLRRRLRIGVIPGSVLVLLPVHHQGVVARLPLPRTRGSGRAGAQVLAIHRDVREIQVSLHRLYLITLRDYLAIPSRLRHRLWVAFSGSCAWAFRHEPRSTVTDSSSQRLADRSQKTRGDAQRIPLASVPLVPASSRPEFYGCISGSGAGACEAI